MKVSTRLMWLIGLLLLASLACAQAGEILTPEEATRQVEEGAVGSTEEEALGTEGPQVGDMVILKGTGFLINLLDEPGGTIIAGQERGAEAEVLNVTESEGELWYRIEASGGTGWVGAETIELIGGGDAGAEGDGGDDATIENGATVYLTGVGFLINLMEEPGGDRIIANQQRGATVTVVEQAEVDGETWYFVDAATGQGWVTGENVTTEAP